MKKITYFSLPLCIPCVEASRWVTEVMYENPQYDSLEFEMIDASKNWDKAKAYNLQEAPSFYLDGEMIHAGDVTKEIIESIFKTADESGDA